MKLHFSLFPWLPEIEILASMPVQYGFNGVHLYVRSLPPYVLYYASCPNYPYERGRTQVIECILYTCQHPEIYVSFKFRAWS